MVKNLSANAGDVRDVSSMPGWGRSPGGGHGESHGQKSLVGYSPLGRKESDTTEVTWHACTLSDHICASTLLADGETKAQRWEGACPESSRPMIQVVP